MREDETGVWYRGEAFSKARDANHLGATSENNLSPEKRTNKITRECFGLLVNIKVVFNYMEER